MSRRLNGRPIKEKPDYLSNSAIYGKSMSANDGLLQMPHQRSHSVGWISDSASTVATGGCAYRLIHPTSGALVVPRTRSWLSLVGNQEEKLTGETP